MPFALMWAFAPIMLSAFPPVWIGYAAVIAKRWPELAGPPGSRSERDA